MKISGHVTLSGWGAFALARNVLVARWPYAAPIVYAFSVEDAPGFGTLGVSADLVLTVDLDWFAKLGPQVGAACLAHEVEHVRRETHLRSLDLTGGMTSLHTLANVAADLPINQMLVAAKWPITDAGGLLPKDLQLPDNGTHESYFAALRNRTLPAPKLAAGACGSCAFGGAPSGRTHDSPLDAEGAARRGGRSAAEVQSILHEAAQIAKTAGSTPGEVKLWAGGVLADRQVPWESLLSRAVRRGCEWAAGATDFRFSGRSKRQDAIGEDGPILPKYATRRPKVELVEDVSGSMYAGRSRVLSLVEGVLKATRATITYISVDVEILDQKQLRSLQQLQGGTGGGGTDFESYFADRACRPPPDVTVFITDGYASGVPRSPPPGRWVWVIVPQGKVPASWGEVIHIKE